MLSTTLISIIFGILITLVSLLLFLFSMYKCCKKDMEKSDRPYLIDFTVGSFMIFFPLVLVSFIKMLQIGIDYLKMCIN